MKTKIMGRGRGKTGIGADEDMLGALWMFTYLFFFCWLHVPYTMSAWLFSHSAYLSIYLYRHTF